MGKESFQGKSSEEKPPLKIPSTPFSYALISHTVESALGRRDGTVQYSAIPSFIVLLMFIFVGQGLNLTKVVKGHQAFQGIF